MIEFVELRLYADSNATTYELLPLMKVPTFDVKYNEVGSISFDYPLVEGKALGLKDQALVGVVCGFSNGTAREVERYIIESTDDTKVSDNTRLISVTARATLGAYMDDATVYPSNWPVTAPTGHEFINATVGTIMRTLVLRAKNRGCFPFLDETSFSGTADSAGVAWNAQHTQNYATGTTYLQILKDFMELGYIDAWMEGNSLKINNGGTRGVHIGIGTVELRPAHNVSEMVTTTKSDESATTVLIEGEEGTAVERHNAAFQTTIGRRRERYVQQGGIADSGVLTLLADADLGLHARIPTEETLGVSNAGLTPFSDFNIGDWVWVRYDTDQDAVERRVRQIAVSVDESGQITLGLTLNTILYEEDVALARRMDQYAGKGGSYGSTPNSQIDVTRPNPPVGVSITPGTYWDTLTRTYTGAFVVNWTAPTLNVDGTALDDLDHYEITWRYKGETTWSASLRTSGTETSIGYSPVTPGRTLQVQVRAVDKSANASDWTAVVEQAVPADVTPPPTPSKPVLNSRLGAIRAYWDGKTSTGASMPVDFSYVTVHIGPNTTFATTSANLVATLDRAGQVVAGIDLPYGSTQFVRFVAYDTSGNASGASEAAEITVKALVDTDLIGEIIDGANLKDGTVTASEKIIGKTITGELIKGLAVETGHLAANAVTTPKLAAGAVSADRLSIGTSPVSVLMNSNMEDAYVDAAGVANPNRFAGWETSYWGGNGGVTTQNTTTPISGTRSMRLTFATDADALRVITDLTYPVVPGQVWALSARVKANRSIDKGTMGGAELFALTFHTSDGTEPPDTIFGAKSSWQTVSSVDNATGDEIITLSGTVTVPDGHRQMMVSLNCGVSGDGSGYIADIDEIYAVQAAREFQVANGSGEVTASITESGDTLVHDLTVNGTAYVDLARVDVGGESLRSYIDRRPRGPIARGFRGMGGVALPVGYTSAFSISTYIDAGRVFRFHVNGQADSTTTNNRWNLQVRYTYDAAGPPAAEPTSASTLLGTGALESTLVAAGEDDEIGNDIHAVGLAAGYYKFGLFANMLDAAATARATWYMHILDVGADVEYLPNSAYWTGSGGVVTSAELKTYTKTYSPTGTTWYTGGGTSKGDGVNQFFGNSSATGEGRRKAVLWFPKSAINNDIGNAASTVIDKVELYLYLFDGGNNNTVPIGRHTDTTPGDNDYSTLTGDNREVQTAGTTNWDEGTGRWVNLTAASLKEWKSGDTLGGYIIGPATSDSDSYAGGIRGKGHNLEPKLRITYRKA